MALFHPYCLMMSETDIPAVVWPLLALAAGGGVIWFLGSGRFGRAQTQRWIDKAHAVPALHEFLNKHHGKFRAAAHYVEFGGLFLVLYWLWDAAFGSRVLAFRWLPALAIAVIGVVAAYLDELHQLRSGTRKFRRVDLLHSTCGIAIAMALLFWQSVLRDLE